MRVLLLSFTLSLILFGSVSVSYAQDLPAPYQEMKEKALAGDAQAQMDLGEAYFKGSGDLDESVEEGLKWYEMAAKKGNADAQFALGFLRMMLARELKTEEERIKAGEPGFAWVAAAAAQDHKKATEIVSQFKQSLEKEEGKRLEMIKSYFALGDEYIALYVTPFQDKDTPQENAE